ncbi:putative ferric-chelate reductase 1 [Diadema setosum]|uniref:putative ferric-chelate reductase 1 n=1 Tax=Diadema setosum TaxID=31175 RepID=UPI003B3AD962
MKHVRVFLLHLSVLLVIQLVIAHGQEDANDGSISDPFSEEGCNEIRGCFFCDDSAGTRVSWIPDPEENAINFTLWGSVEGNSGYVAVGITTTKNMLSGDVYACTLDAGTASFERYWTPAVGRGAEPRTLKGVPDYQAEVVDGELRCQFRRVMSLNDGDAEFYDVSGNENISYLIMAKANSFSGSIGFHQNFYCVSEDLVLANSTSAEAEEESPVLMQIHGCLMIIAWMGFASIGITVARFFKPMWPNSTLCGEKVWFSIHRTCMLSAFGLFIMGFIIIFVHVGGIIGRNEEVGRLFAHTICGILATACGVINPIMAIFRPHPGTEYRPIFNWAHWAVGLLGYCLAITTIGLALAPIEDSTILPGLETYTFWILIAYIGFYTLLWILFEILRCVSDSAGRSDDIPLSGKDAGPPEPADASENPSGATIKSILLFIYTFGTIFVVAFLIIVIVIL